MSQGFQLQSSYYHIWISRLGGSNLGYPAMHILLSTERRKNSSCRIVQTCNCNHLAKEKRQKEDLLYFCSSCTKVAALSWLAP